VNRPGVSGGSGLAGRFTRAGDGCAVWADCEGTGLVLGRPTTSAAAHNVPICVTCAELQDLGKAAQNGG